MATTPTIKETENGVNKTRNRVGVSEMVATLILIAITLAGFGLYSGFIQRNVSLATLGPVQELQVSQARAGEQVGLVYVGYSTNTVSLFLVSYGTSPVSISTIILTPGGGSPMLSPAASLTVLDPSTGKPICSPGPSACSASSAKLLQENTTEVVVSASGNVASPITVTLVTGDNALFVWSA